MSELHDEILWELVEGAKPERAPDPPGNVDTPLADQVAQRIIAAGRTRRAKPAPTPAADAIELQLAKAVERAQQSLDEYLASVADPEIVQPLKESRDHARRAFENYLKRKAAA